MSKIRKRLVIPQHVQVEGWPSIHIDLFTSRKGLQGALFGKASEPEYLSSLGDLPFTYSFQDTFWKEEILQWIRSYLEKKETPFAFPFDDDGLSTFQKKALKKIAEIPFGSTCSYREIAEEIGGAHLARAVGTACRTNPWPLFIGCHRVIAHSGALGGFAYSLPLKQHLLLFEKTN
jgi:methylated-DNA-[protein]-cysteine S-methyltransferase